MSATRYERLKSGLIVPKGRARRVTSQSGPAIITRRNFLAAGAATLLSPSQAHATVLSLLAHAPIIAAGSAGGTSAGINPTGSTALFIAVTGNRSVSPTISDSLSNPWGSNIGANGNTNIQCSMNYYTNSPNVGAGQTFSALGGGTNCQAVAFGFNLVTTGSLHQVVNGNGFDTAGGTTITNPAITPTTANNLAISICTNQDAAATMSVDSGFIIINSVTPTVNAVGIVVAYKAQNTAAAVAPTWTSSTPFPAGAATRTSVFGLSADPFGGSRGILFHSFPP